MFAFSISVDFFLYFQGPQQNTSDTFFAKEEGADH